ncbi:MAG: Xaa-Pro dipeptidase [Firmicutes bacterium HGW-Firmicutes-14]|nr:MAG: Xaa-Pro dipeptidase [Firmicutes bacterium HGW-Firmicutes-14]
MNNRIEAVRAVVREKGLDGLIISKQENRQYLSGFTGTDGVLLITAADNLLITDFRYLDQAAEEAPEFRVIRPLSLVEDALSEQVKGLGLKRIGFEDENIAFSTYYKYQGKMPGVELVPLSQAVEKVRWIKDGRELDYIRKAAAITDITFDHLLDFIRPGVAESELALEIEYFMKRKGAQKSAFDIIVASGPRAALPHGTASDKKLEIGEFIVLDFGAVVNGYHSDMTRTVVLGDADNQQREIYDIVLRAQEKAVNMIKPGTKCSGIDLAARDLISLHGYGANFGHSLGHAVGLEIHEKPGFSPKDETLLEPGMVLTVEPGIYLSGWGGVRIEDLIVVTEDGCEVLSGSSRALISL